MHKFKNSSSTWKNIEISNVKCHNRILNHNLFTLYTWVFNNLLFYQITRKKVYIPIRLSTLNLTTNSIFLCYSMTLPPHFFNIFIYFLNNRMKGVVQLWMYTSLNSIMCNILQVLDHEMSKVLLWCSKNQCWWGCNSFGSYLSSSQYQISEPFSLYVGLARPYPLFIEFYGYYIFFSFKQMIRNFTPKMNKWNN
jgi:hypothetical protein